ncbi:PREDICTED: uncharacterized protein LOC109353656 [Lupinus angustifolius]|uniref:uncharacterized protein LOC109353656 n=1 Tax=Lupinus angustifolius TaxID=3871 RepID=UPI00092FD50F|nr:PREDICTED: uncharacterized protein LOC109353656 [Lupinus angustifolius]XP_019451554.1 PREDICTED: uncharacterized protein LOC109353656 [Lupinus angustifolius]XP_019451562.1 PREDICTED: uncharacterized protein LOC109353656 [Lupinus angustifolius]
MKDDDSDNDDDPLNPNSMVLIRDFNDFSVFPPNNHENLQIFSHHHSIPESTSSPSSSSSFSSFSPSDSDSLSPFNSQLRRGADFVAWMSLGIHILRSKLYAIVSSFRNCDSERRVVSSIGVPAGVVVMLCWIMMRFWWWVRKWRKKRNFKRNEIRLRNIIKEKDEIIAKLLHQIAQMNEILIARHKALAAKIVD